MIKQLMKILSIFVIGILLISSMPSHAYSIDLKKPTNNSLLNDDIKKEVIEISRDADWYHKPSNYDELVSWYESLEQNFSNFIEIIDANEMYGTNAATGGYTIYYVRVTNESLGFHKPEVLFLGSPHGDETVGTIGMYWFLDWFTRKAFTDEPCIEYSKDWLNWLVDNREIYFEISHNPYGFDHDQRYDGNGWDLNREADYDGPGTPTGGIWASENGKTLHRFINNHTIRVGCDLHGGTRMLIYPWASTYHDVTGTSPISGESYEGAPPDFYFYDASSLRVGSYMGNAGGDGDLNEYNIGTIDEMIWYSVYGGIAPWAYAADVEQNPLEDPYVEDEIFGNYPGTGILWLSPEMSYTKNPSESYFGNDTTPGWGWEIRRYILHQTDIAQPYVRWQDGTIENHMAVSAGEPISFRWQVNGSLVVDHTLIQWGTNPDPINNYDYSTTDHDENEGNYIGGTGWDNADDGTTDGVIFNEEIIINIPGEYYFVTKAQVDQIYANVLRPDEYGDDPYLRLVKERTNASYYESLSGTDGLEEIIGQDWWYSNVIHVTVGDHPPTAQYIWVDADGSENPGTVIDFDASASTGDNSIVLYEWDWTNDGSYDYSSSLPTVSYDYGDGNVYECKLRVTDNTSKNGTFIDIVQANNIEEIDLNQSIFNRGFRLMPGWDAAQEFIPTFDVLSSVDLYLSKFGSPTGDVTVQICEDTADGTVVFEGVISPGDVPSFPDYEWVTLDISDITVTPGNTYYIVLKDATGADTHNCVQWGWCDSYASGSGGPYDGGWFWFRKEANPTWSPIRDWDFTVRTFGYN